MEEEKVKKQKEHRLTAQCFGIILVVFAFGLFIGHTLNYQDIIANFISHEADSIHIVHNSSEMAEEGARIVFYNLGATESNSYNINYNDEPEQSVNRFYIVSGEFTNTTERHFTTVKLNFSLLDKSGNKIGDAYAFCDGLDPNQTWEFKAENTIRLGEELYAASAVLDDVIYSVL